MKTIKQAKWCYIICSILISLLGFAIAIKPQLSAITLCTIFGIITIICGISKIFGYISHDLYNLAFQFDLALGIFTVGIGAVLLIKSQRIVEFLPIVIGLFIFVDGIFKLQTSIDAKKFGLKNWWLILIGSLLCIVLSLILIFDPFSGGNILMVFVGVSLVIDGVQNLINAFYTVKIIKNTSI